MDDWENEDFEPKFTSQTHVKGDRWEGEDEEDNVKDSWDKESSDEESLPSAVSAVQTKKKKKIADILAEKEASKIAQFQAKAAEEAANQYANTPEGKAAEKLRLLKLEENTNLELAKDMLGVNTGSIDSMVPVSKEDFENFNKALTQKITNFSSSDHYPEFVENFVKNLSLDLNASTLKKIKMTVEALHSTKLKEEKAAKAKKSKGKAGSVKMDLTKDLYIDGGGGYDDLDDFM